MSERIILTVRSAKTGEEILLSHDTGKTVLETLRESEITLPSLCSGMGTCGRCMVRFLGYSPLPTQTERGRIEPDRLRQGYRLSCMAKPVKDCVISVSFEKEKIKILTESPLETSREEQAEDYGELKEGSTLIAVDLGTTTIAMRLLEARTGRVCDTFTCLNPQRSYGADVVERIRAGSEGKGTQLRKLVQDAVSKGKDQFFKTAEDEKLCKPNLMIIACNTAMGHLFMGYPTDTLGRSPFKPVNIGLAESVWEGLRVILLPGISAFVGGDIVAGLYACGLQTTEKPWIFLDLGTNAEMVIGSGGRFLCTAAAAGPAFEGRGEGNTTGPERIGAVARLLEKGLIDETGLLEEPYFETGIDVEGIFITQKDIRDLQMAKAAVRTGIHFLLENSGITDCEKIEKVYLAGGFGFYLDRTAAAAIGLIPPELKEKLHVAGNTSLIGAGTAGRKIMKDISEKKELDDIITNCEVFNLAVQHNFDTKYIEYMNFCKWSKQDIV